MWKAGFFRLRGVLVGTLAYQGYAGLLGVRLGQRPLMTQDADFGAVLGGVSENIGESMGDPLAVLQKVDPTFRALPHINDPFVSTRYRNRRDYAVDFLTPNRGSPADHQGRPARMKAPWAVPAPSRCGISSTCCTRRSGPGSCCSAAACQVTDPRAERYAIHKLIGLAASRVDQTKAPKDILQAHTLIQALAALRPARSWEGAHGRSPGRAETGGDRSLQAGRQRLPAEGRRQSCASSAQPAHDQRVDAPRESGAIGRHLAAEELCLLSIRVSMAGWTAIGLEDFP